MKTIKEILLFIWQLPQNILGAIVLLVNFKSIKEEKIEVAPQNKITVYRAKHVCGSAVSLGRWIIVDSDACYGIITIRHEHGHQRQSLYLGWLYLVLIGLPSLCGNIIDRVFHRKWDIKRRIKWYYSQPWEKWADKLGGVERFS